MSGSDWEMRGHDLEHTGETSDVIKNPKNLKLKWKFETGSSVYSSPAISGNFVYVGSHDNYVYCLNKNTGELLWKFKTGSYVDSSPAISGNFVYVGSDDNYVYCLNKNTGELVWKFKTGNWVYSSPAVSGNFVYVSSYDNYVYCLNKNTGELVWKFKTGNWVYSSPAVSGNFVYVSSYDNYVYCLNKNTGELVWKFETGNWVYSSPAVSGNFVYVGSRDSYVYCLNKNTGELVWKFKKNTGELIWKFKTGDWVRSSPAISGNFVYVGSYDSYVYCLNKNTGELVWKFETGNGVYSSPAISGNFVYVSSWDDYVYCLNKNTGELLWKFETGNGVYSSPAISGNFVYVGSLDNYVYAFEAEPVIEEWQKEELKRKLNSLNTEGFESDVEHLKLRIGEVENENDVRGIEEKIKELKIKVDERIRIKKETERRLEEQKLRLQKEELHEKLDLLNVEGSGLESDAAHLKVRIDNIKSEYEAEEIEKKINELKIRVDEEKRIKKEQEKLRKQKELYGKLYSLNTEGFESEGEQLKLGIARIENENDIKEIDEKLKELKVKTEEKKRIEAEREKLKQEKEEQKPEKKQPTMLFPGTFPDGLKKYYDNSEFIGEGGFAYVFGAIRNEDNKAVAIKIPKEMNDKIGELFLKEIRIWGDLHHKNIVKLYKANIYPCPYLEIEYVDGGSLDGISKPVSVEKASKLINDLLDGLKEAHSKNIYHLDLKPENVLLTSDGEPKITDWGLSKIAKHSKYSKVAGHTLMYAAPELFSPEDFGKADCRTDIFQIGTIFYELVTGKNPFDGDTQQQILMNILMKKPKKPSEINPAAKELDVLILKCLEKKKENRYQNVSELQNALISYMKTEYKKSFTESKLRGDVKRSCFYCGELVKSSAKTRDMVETLKWINDFKDYAKGEDAKDIKNIINELVQRMENKLEITDELTGKIEVVVHHIQMQ